jgi:hypothetical protein
MRDEQNVRELHGVRGDDHDEQDVDESIEHPTDFAQASDEAELEPDQDQAGEEQNVGKHVLRSVTSKAAGEPYMLAAGG